MYEDVWKTCGYVIIYVTDDIQKKKNVKSKTASKNDFLNMVVKDLDEPLPKRNNVHM